MINFSVYLVNRRVKAFLLLIADCEGTTGPEGYAALYGYDPIKRPERLMTSFSDHPRRKFHFDGREILPPERAQPYQFTTAAGKYQATESSWSDFRNDCGPHDFSPTSQDQFAIWRICIVSDSMISVMSGNLHAALRKLSPVWASFPYSGATSGRRDVAFCELKYQQHLKELL